MRVLFNNLIYDATLTSTYADGSYPVTNLIASAVKKIYKSTEVADQITITFDETQTIDSCFVGYTNATSITLLLYNSSDALLYTQAIDTDKLGKVFTPIDNVSYAVVNFVSTETLYIGTVGLGKSYTMPDPDNGIVTKPIDYSTREFSTGGQLYINRVPIRKTFDTTISNILVDDYNEIFALWANLEHPVWVDVYEETSGIINPIFADVVMGEDPTQSWKRYALTLTFTEVK